MRRRLWALASCVALCIGSNAVAQVAQPSAPSQRIARPAPSIAPAPATLSSGSNVVACETAFLEYINGAAILACVSANGSHFNFTVLPTDKPSSTDVVAFVQPFLMAERISQVMPSVGVSSATPAQSFAGATQLRLRHENGKLIGMRISPK